MPKSKKLTRILMVGGGSGGHIVPAVAVAKELQKSYRVDELEMRFWCDYKTYSVARNLFPKSILVQSVVSGKFRRYHHLPWWQHLRPSISLPNIADAVKLVIGFGQSLVKLLIWRPQVVFAKGGFVCLPVGLAASCLRIKLVIHDSDTVAGMTNRILSRFATKIATGYPVKYYQYDNRKVVYTGIPTDNQYRPTDDSSRRKMKRQLGLEEDRPVILITGGGLGSQILNNNAISLAQARSDYQVVLISGQLDYQRISSVAKDMPNLQIHPFVNELFNFVQASDLVVARAGATTLAELAMAGALAILVPNHRLVGGHQLANAKIMKNAGAALVVLEEEIREDKEGLVLIIQDILSKSQHSHQQIQQKILSFAKPQAATKLAAIIREEAR